MKQLFILALMAIAITTTAFASSDAKDHFSAVYRNAKNVTWKINNQFEKASFMEGKDKVEVFYDFAGEMIGTGRTFAFDKLPKSAIATITTKYTFPVYTLRDCIEFTDAGNNSTYYISLDKKDESVVLKITDGGLTTVFERTKK